MKKTPTTPGPAQAPYSTVRNPAPLPPAPTDQSAAGEQRGRQAKQDAVARQAQAAAGVPAQTDPFRGRYGDGNGQSQGKKA